MYTVQPNRSIKLRHWVTSDRALMHNVFTSDSQVDPASFEVMHWRALSFAYSLLRCSLYVSELSTPRYLEYVFAISYFLTIETNTFSWLIFLLFRWNKVISGFLRLGLSLHYLKYEYTLSRSLVQCVFYAFKNITLTS